MSGCTGCGSCASGSRQLPEPCFAADRGGDPSAAALRRAGLFCQPRVPGPMKRRSISQISATGPRSARPSSPCRSSGSSPSILPCRCRASTHAGYEDYPVRGSMALTAAGREALDSLNIQGCGE
ncbi:MAG: hypothetical protein ACLU3I_05310 [Acutalibacteraceae bacterium]